MRNLIILVLIILACRAVKGIIQDVRAHKKTNSRESIDEMVQDPACGMYVPRRNSLHRTIAGRECFFCGSKCAEDYERRVTRA